MHDPNNPLQAYAPPRAATPTGQPPVARRQSLLGVASFVIGILAAVTAFGLIVIAGVMEASTPGGIDEESAEAMIVGLGIFGVLAGNALGVALGIAGLIEPNKSRIFAALGIMGNLMVILGIVGLGRIGQEVARRALAFQMRVIGFDPFLSRERASEVRVRPGQDGVHHLDDGDL